MDINYFYELCKKRVCPICKGNNIKKVKNTYGNYFMFCNNCDGIPAICHSNVYIFQGYDGTFTTCERCGETPADINTHLVAFYQL